MSMPFFKHKGKPKILLIMLFLFLFALRKEVLVAAETHQSWQAEWDKTVAAAKQEGRVTIYGSGQSSLVIQAGVFQKRFPDIKVDAVVGRALERILAERRAGKYLVDVATGGSSTTYDLYRASALDPIRDIMILPEVIDTSKWWEGKHHFMDPESRHGIKYLGYPEPGGIHYNTKLVERKEFQSFWNFLNPKWKGKIQSRDIRTPGTGTANMRGFYYNPRLGPQFIRRFFSEMDVTLFRDVRQGVDWLATGKFAVCFFCSKAEMGLAKRQGLPVDLIGVLKEGMSLTASSGTLGLVNRAPHPNASKVFINWFLSREGQLTFQREASKAMVLGSNSLRVDIPKDMVPPDERLEEGVKYIDVDSPETISSEPFLKIVKEALAMAGK